jgi:GntR family transcriptional regulator, transcriptional repressor for pyruvate dehydrogenase complex
VSRTSVREAIHRLAAGGYVTVLRGRNGGAVVQTAWGAGATEMIRALLPDWEHFEWLVDFRGLIEPLIARTAAERRGERDRQAIQTALDDDRQAIQTALDDDRHAAGPEASRAADLALHDAIARATHNPYLVGVSRQIRAQLSVGFGSQRHSQAIRARAAAQHADLAAAIAKGHAAEAAEAAARHVTLVDEWLPRRAHR